MKKQWRIATIDPLKINTLCHALKCHPATAAVLIRRHHTDPDAAKRFVKAPLSGLQSPFAIKDMDRAVKRIHQALDQNQKILIFGDYDADGVSATVIMHRFLADIGARVAIYIPHRFKEGYGLRPRHICDVAVPQNIDLIITVDCGSSSQKAIEKAAQNRIDVIVTDHHQIGEVPQATAVVNPNRSDCTAGFEDMAGVGVAFCLLVCLRKHLRDLNFWRDGKEPNLKELCDLVAIGTMADAVDLTLENRRLINAGLEVIRSGRRPGLFALMEACGIQQGAISAQDITFKLIPRINAAGRMAHAEAAVALLSTTHMDEATRLARDLSDLNVARQAAEAEINNEIGAFLHRNPDTLKKSVLVLARSGWHEGVLGIVASRLMQQYFRPVVLITVTGDIGKGSARSISGINIYRCIEKSADTLTHFGGHAAAAGLTLKAENIAAFRRHLEQAVEAEMVAIDIEPVLDIDYKLDFDAISDGLIDEIEALEPFGKGNPQPVFMSEDIQVVSAKTIAVKHRRMTLKQTGSQNQKMLAAIHFNAGDKMLETNRFKRIAYGLQWNRYNGRKTPQLVIEAVE